MLLKHKYHQRILQHMINSVQSDLPCLDTLDQGIINHKDQYHSFSQPLGYKQTKATPSLNSTDKITCLDRANSKSKLSNAIKSQSEIHFQAANAIKQGKNSKAKGNDRNISEGTVIGHLEMKPSATTSFRPHKNNKLSYAVQIDIGGGRRQVIQVCQGVQTLIAQEFCQEHQLGKSIQGILAQALKEHSNRQLELRELTPQLWGDDTNHPQDSSHPNQNQNSQTIQNYSHKKRHRQLNHTKEQQRVLQCAYNLNNSTHKPHSSSKELMKLWGNMEDVQLIQWTEEYPTKQYQQELFGKVSLRERVQPYMTCPNVSLLLRSDSMAVRNIEIGVKHVESRAPMEATETKSLHLTSSKFKSFINPVSKEIVTRLGKENIMHTIDTRSRIKLNKILHEKQLKQQQEAKQCIFKPQINSISQRVEQVALTLREESEPRHVALYRQHQQIKQKKEMLHEQLVRKEGSYRPQINDISRVIASRRASHAAAPKPPCQDKSQSNSKPKYSRKSAEKSHQSFNKTTLCHHLYQQAVRRQHKRQLQLNESSQKPLLKPNQNSEAIVEELKVKSLSRVFEKLLQLSAEDEEQTMLTSEGIRLILESLPQQLRLLEPLLEQAVEMNVSLSEMEFIEAGERLFKYLNPAEKTELLGFNVAKTHHEPLEQTKMINQRSAKILEGKNYSTLDIYERGIRHRKQSKEYAGKEFEEKVRKQLMACTFKPNIGPQVAKRI